MQASIIPIKAFNDNYIWLYQSPDSSACFVVDPGDAVPVLTYLQENDLTLEYILVTHHHYDHTGGVLKLAKETGAIVFGPQNSPFQSVDFPLAEDDHLELKKVNCELKVFEVPGHTLDHIAYYNDDLLFCGDTLFSAGCGRLFEGDAEQLYNSLNKLKNLPESTKVYCAHEYTLANLKFAKTVNPSNPDINHYYQKAQQMREQNRPTLPSSIALEQKVNPFLRCQDTEIISHAEKQINEELTNSLAVFTALRQMKDVFST